VRLVSGPLTFPHDETFEIDGATLKWDPAALRALISIFVVAPSRSFPLF